MLVLTLRTLNIDFRHAMTQTNEIFIHSRQSGSKNTCILSQGFTLQTSSQSASVERVDGSLYGRVPPPSPCKHHRSWHRRWHTHTHINNLFFEFDSNFFENTHILHMSHFENGPCAVIFKCRGLQCLFVIATCVADGAVFYIFCTCAIVIAAPMLCTYRVDAPSDCVTNRLSTG